MSIVLFPLLLAVMLAHTAGAIAFVLLFVLPYFILRNAWESLRFWKRLRLAGRVASWSEVEPLLATGAGTLVVELGPKGPGCSWWIDRPRSEIDPDRVAPSWQDYEDRDWDVFEPEEESRRMERWATDRLGPFESSARALTPSWAQLDRLGSQTKREAVVVLLFWGKGCLSDRCA